MPDEVGPVPLAVCNGSNVIIMSEQMVGQCSEIAESCTTPPFLPFSPCSLNTGKPWPSSLYK